MVQALAFAEILFGGLLVTSAIKKIPLQELLLHGLQGLETPGPSQQGPEGGAPSGNIEGAPLTPKGEAEAGGGGVNSHLPPPPSASKGAVLQSTEHELSKFLKRPLTSKEKAELRSLQSKGEL